MSNDSEKLFRPLAGVQGVEVTGEMGVLAGRLLADLGADIIRVEAPEGDSVRSRPPFVSDGPRLERSLAHQHYNAGKRSFTCRLTTPEGRDQVSALLQKADLFLLDEDLGRRLGLSGDWFECLPHSLVRVVIRAFPADSPRSKTPFTDLVGMAAGGELYMTGFPDQAPLYPAGQLGYGMVSLVAATAAVVGLLGRQRTGAAHEISTCMQEALALTTMELANVNAWLQKRVIPRRYGKSHPLYGGLYQARGGRWVIFNFFDWTKLAGWFEDEGLGHFGAEYHDPDYRVARFEETIEPLIRLLCSRHPVEKLIAEGQRRGMYHMSFSEVDEIRANELLKERRFFFELRPDEMGVSLPFQRLPFLTSRGVARTTRAAPRLGADTSTLLASVKRSGGPADSRSPGALRASPTSTHLLCGLRVLDFCTAIAGPLATRVFANLGSEVIKVESAAHPDAVRHVGFTSSDQPKTLNSGPCFNDVSSGKLSITLNLKTPRGIQLAKELVALADVVISNFASARTMEVLGLGIEELRKVKPDLISLSCSTVGENRANLAYRAFGTAISAAAGVNAVSGNPCEPPIGLGVAHSDYSGPYFAAMALLAALYERDRTGQGVHIDMSQLEGAVWLLETKLMEYAVTGDRPRRLGNHSESMAPHGVYRCDGEDAWCAVSVRDDEDWRRLCLTLGRSDLAADTDLATLPGRKAASARLDQILGEWCARHEVWEAAQLLTSAGVPASPVETNRDLAERDEGMREFYEDLEHPEGTVLRIMGDPLQVDGQRLPIRRGPLLGEHNRRIFGDLLGYSPVEIARLVGDGVIGAPA